MAYGMLTSFGLGALQGLGNAVVNKLSRDQEAELKNKAEIEREARIEEAKIRAEQRAADPNTLENKVRQAQLDSATAQNNEYNSPEAIAARKAKLLAETADANFKSSPEHQQNLSDKELADLEAIRQQTAASKANVNNATVTREKNQLEIDKENKLNDLIERINAETDPDKRDILIQQANITAGKFNEGVTLQTTKTVIGTDRDGKPITEEKMYWVNTKNRTVTPVDAPNLTREQRNQAAVDKANAKYGTLYKSADEVNKIATDSSWFNQKTPEEKKAATDWLKTYGTELASQSYDKPSGGMLNGKNTDKVETGKVSNTESLIKVSNPIEQKQLDNLFNIIKAGESGGKGVNAGTPKPTPDNPHPTASGTFQITDDNLKSHGIKPELPNGKYSAAQKDAFAPTYYKEVYEGTGGNQAAMTAAGFGQEDVYQAMKKARNANSRKWWDYLTPDGGVEKNMPIIKNRINQQWAYLLKNDIPVPNAITDFLLYNK